MSEEIQKKLKEDQEEAEEEFRKLTEIAGGWEWLVPDE